MWKIIFYVFYKFRFLYIPRKSKFYLIPNFFFNSICLTIIQNSFCILIVVRNNYNMKMYSYIWWIITNIALKLSFLCMVSFLQIEMLQKKFLRINFKSIERKYQSCIWLAWTIRISKNGIDCYFLAPLIC